MSVTTFVALIGVFIAGGKLFDVFLVRRKEIADPVSLGLHKFWYAVQAASSKDLAVLSAYSLIAPIDRFLGGSMGLIKKLVVWTAVSWLLTTGAANLDHLFLEPGAHPEVKDKTLVFPMFPAYVANWIFDLLIFAITVAFLRRIARNPGPWAVVGAVLVNVGAVTTLYVACMATAIAGFELTNSWPLPGYGPVQKERLQRLERSVPLQLSGDRNLGSQRIEISEQVRTKDVLACTRASIALLLTEPYGDCGMRYKVRAGQAGHLRTWVVMVPLHPNYTMALTCGTVFTPTIVFCALVLFLMLYKALLHAHCWLLEGTLEADTFAPGTVLGYVLSFIATLVTLISGPMTDTHK